MNLKNIFLLFLGVLLILISIIGVIDLLNESTISTTSVLILFILPGLIFLYKGITYSSSSKGEGITYGGFCKTCGEWCEIIYLEDLECCDCTDDLPLNDRCPTCYEKSQDRMS